MEGTGYPQLSPVRIGRLGYLHGSPPYTLPLRQVPRQPAWFGRFPGSVEGTSLRSFRILLPQKEASIAPATDHSAFRVPVLLHRAPCWRQPPSPGDCSDGKARKDAGIPAPGACRHASRPREKRFTPGCKKCEIKDELEYGLLQTTVPAFTVPFRDFRVFFCQWEDAAGNRRATPAKTPCSKTA